MADGNKVVPDAQKLLVLLQSLNSNCGRLCSTPIDSRALNNFIESDFAWLLFQVLSHLNWNVPNQPSEFVNEFINAIVILRKLIPLAVDKEGVSDHSDLQQLPSWYNLLSASFSSLSESTSVQSCKFLSASNKSTPHRRRKCMKKRSYLNAVRSTSLVELGDDADPEGHSQSEQSQGDSPCAHPHPHTNIRLNVSEDSDGFAAGWGDRRASRHNLQIGRHMLTVDVLLAYRMDIDSLSQVSPQRLSRRKSPFSLLLLLMACLRKAFELASHLDFVSCMIKSDVVQECMQWSCILKRDMLSDCSDENSFVRRVILQRHWVDCFVAIMHYFSGVGSCSSTWQGVDCLTDQLRLVSLLLNTSSTVQSGDMTRECLQLLLDNGHRIFIGLMHIALATLPTINCYNTSMPFIAESLQTAVRLVSMCRDGGIDESLRDLLIAVDMLSQVNFQPPSVETVVNGPLIDNAYSSMLFSLLLSVAGLSHRLYQVKSLWLHGTRCCKSDHISCYVSSHDRCRHHHTVLNMPSLNKSNNLCACSFLNNCLLSSYRHLTGRDSRVMLSQALHGCGWCCCLPFHKLLQALVLPDSNQDTVANLVTSEFINSFPTESIGQCSFCKTSHEIVEEGEMEYTDSLLDCVKSGVIKLEHVTALARRCNGTHKDVICYTIVVPLLAQELGNADFQTTLREEISQLLEMCSLTLHCKGGYTSVTNGIIRPPYTGLLLLNESTRRSCVNLLKCGVNVEETLLRDGELAEWDVDSASVFARSFLEQLQMIIKLMQKDLMNLVAEPGNNYWSLSVELLEACVHLASEERGSFSRILISSGFGSACLSIVNDCIFSVEQCNGGCGRRLCMLLNNAIRVALITNSPNEIKELIIKCTNKLLNKSNLNWNGTALTVGHMCRTFIQCSVVYDKQECNGNESNHEDDSQGYLAEVEFIEPNEEEVFVTNVTPWLCSLGMKSLSKCLKHLDKSCAADVQNTLQVFHHLISCLDSTQIQGLRREDIIRSLWDILTLCADLGITNVLDHIVQSLKLFFQVELLSEDLKNLSDKLLRKNSDSYGLLLLDMLCSVLRHTALPPYYRIDMPNVVDLSRPVSPSVFTSSSLPIPVSRVSILRRSRSEIRRSLSEKNTPETSRNRSKGGSNASDSSSSSGVIVTGLSQFFSSTLSSPPPTKPTVFEPYGAFSLANLYFPLNSSNIDVILNDGVTVSTWINVTQLAPKLKDEDFESDLQRSLQMSLNSQPLRHVLCVGNANIHFALYLNQYDGTIDIKLIEEAGLTNHQLCPRFRIRTGIWTHLTMSVKCDAQTGWNVTIGCCNRKQLYTYSAVFGANNVPPEKQTVCMGLGFCVEEKLTNSLSFSVANSMIFKCVLTNEDRIILFGLGPRCTSIVDTKARALEPILLPLLRRTWSTIRNSIDWITLLDEKDSFIHNLQPNLLCVYLAAFPNEVLHYSFPQHTRSLPPELWPKPEPHNVVSQSALSTVTSHSLVDAFDSLGGARYFLMLFARLVDIEAKEMEQARGLQLELIGMQSDPEIWRDVCNINSYNMIARVLASPLAIKGERLIKVICDHSMSYTENNVTPIIIDESIISCLLLDSRIWMNHLKVWGRCIHRICECFGEDSISKFNLVQLSRGRFTRQLLFFLFEISQSETDVKCIEADVSAAIVTLCEKLVGDPPNISVITELWDFVFLSHPASCTYINIRFSGALDWIDLNLLNEKSVSLLGYQAELVSYMKPMPLAFTPDEISAIVSEGGNVWSNIKNKFVESGLQNVHVPGVTEQSMPDILCDTLAAEPMSSSGDDVEHADAAIKLVEGDKTEDAKLVQEPRWLIVIRAGILRTLSLKLLAGPDTIVLRVVGSIIKWETLIALLNHQPDSMIRSQIVRVLCALLLRSTAAQRTRFLKSFGMRLLANQLKEFNATEEIAESLFSVLCGEALRLEDGLDGGHMAALKPDRLQTSVLSAMLVCYEQSYKDLPLFWNITNALQKILDFNVHLTRALVDADFEQTLVAVLVKLAQLELPTVSEASSLESNLSLECWRGLVSRLIHLCVSSAEPHHGQCLTNLFTLLTIVDRQVQLEGNQHTHYIVRTELCSLLQDCLDTIRGLYSDEGASASTCNSYDSLNVHPSNLNFNPYSASAPSELTSTTSSGSNKVSVTAAFIGESWLNLKDKITGLSATMLGRGIKLATHADITERLKMCLQMSSDVFIHLLPCQTTPETEKTLFSVLSHFLLNVIKRDYVSEGRNRPQSEKEKALARLLDGCKDRARLIMARLIAFVLFPANLKLESIRRKSLTFFDPLRMQILLVRALANQITHKQMLKTLLDINLDYQFAMCMALYELILLREDLNDSELSDVERLLAFLRQIKIDNPAEKLTEKGISSISTDQNLCLQTYQDVRLEWLSKTMQPVNHSLMRQSSADEPVSSEAMSITCAVVAQQNIPRKLFIQQTKSAANLRIQAEDMWKSLVTELCHPAACFADESSWPGTWHLDPTEGPLRQRKRLMPAHLNIDAHFLMPEEQYKLNAANQQPPLSRLLDVPRIPQPNPPPINENYKVGESMDDVEWHPPSCVASQLIDRLHIDEKIVLSINATVLRGTIECSGEILLAENKMYFVGERARTAQKGLPRLDVICLNWEYEDVVEIYKRHYMLRDTALEVFFGNGETYLMCFDTVQNRDLLMQRLMAIELPNLAPTSDRLLQSLTQCWREGNITNFEYLMHLNKLAGRSFSDLMQYPVFPFVLADYHSASLDLNNPLNYRDLAKPMAIQDKKMEDHYTKVYQCLESEARRAPTASLLSIPHFGPYHFGSHYSNSGIVVYYLVRTPPFTAMAIEYQDDRFDVADRLFHSLETTWRLSSSESTTDFKELIPEFFYFPEMFVNFEGFDMGKRQGGERVNDVKLPPWVPDGDPRLFVLIHRQAFESQYVTSILHKWIDLIFGYKQLGQSSIDAINVFHPATYHGTQLASDQQQDLHKHALKAMVRTYGQMPRVLFKSPHLPHFHVKSTSVPPSSPKTGPLNNIFGINWGQFVGSPTCPTPVLVLKQRNTNPPPAHLLVVADTTCVGLSDKSHLLIHYSRRKLDFSPKTPPEIESVVLLAWQSPDAVVRARVQKREPRGSWIGLVALHHHQVYSCAYANDKRRLLLGLSTGVIRIYSISIINNELKNCRLEGELVGLNGDVNVLEMSEDWGIVLGGDAKGNVFMWDLNRLSFVRRLESINNSPISHCAISQTTADIAFVQQIGYGSKMYVRTVNGSCIADVDTDISISSLVMSNLPEGNAVNVIAAGMNNGVIRFWDLWTVSPLTCISHASFLEPIISLCYGDVYRKLYACTGSGAVLCWEIPDSKHCTPPKFVLATLKE